MKLKTAAELVDKLKEMRGDLNDIARYCRTRQQALKDATAKTVAAAAQVSAPVHVLVAGCDCSAVAEAAAKLAGVEEGAACRRSALCARRGGADASADPVACRQL